MVTENEIVNFILKYIKEDIIKADALYIWSLVNYPNGLKCFKLKYGTTDKFEEVLNELLKITKVEKLTDLYQAKVVEGAYIRDIAKRVFEQNWPRKLLENIKHKTKGLSQNAKKLAFQIADLAKKGKIDLPPDPPLTLISVYEELVKAGLLIEYTHFSKKHSYYHYIVPVYAKEIWKNLLEIFPIPTGILETLKKIYIAQHIRDEGVLQSEFSSYRTEIDILKEHGLIRENIWYSHKLYITTEKGRKIASKYIEKSLKELKNIHFLLNKYKLKIPLTTLRFLIFDYFTTKLSFSVNIEEEIFLNDWREPILKDSRIRIIRNNILEALEKEGLCVKARYYVSTRGGETRELCYVISPEVQSFLKEGWVVKRGLEEERKKIAKIYLFLKEEPQEYFLS